MMKVLKNNLKYIIILILTFTILSIRFPYYIISPGGIENISKKIEIDGYKPVGTFNLAYVREYSANTLTLLISVFNKDWKVLSEKDVLLENETRKAYEIRDRILLEESNSNAIYVAYKKASKNIKKISNDVKVAYVLPGNTNLKAGDIILKINNIDINSKQDIADILENLDVGSKLDILVKNNNKNITRNAYVKEENNRKIIGIIISDISKYNTNPSVNIKVNKNESGPSGGLITALSIYNSLTEKDITKGYKIVGTGTVELDGAIGEIGGVTYKLKSAQKSKADLFLVPNGNNCEEAKKEKEKNNYKIDIKCISTFDEAIEFLDSLEAKNN